MAEKHLHVTGLTPKGRSLLESIRVAEQELAAIWREPFEQYKGQQRNDWLSRRTIAMRVFMALWNQL